MSDDQPENVVEIFTKQPVDRRKKPSNQTKIVMDRMSKIFVDHPARSIIIVSIDEKGEYFADFIVQPDDSSKMCVVLRSLADEMSDHALGVEDLEE